ncbi:hypothetical protein EDC04DRAFT_2693576 [Pisolithus marmoratus]|nr:hypothetical protein EDC04DRAFT_2693576 [Pisolithus marmoratus]
MPYYSVLLLWQTLCDIMTLSYGCGVVFSCWRKCWWVAQVLVPYCILVPWNWRTQMSSESETSHYSSIGDHPSLTWQLWNLVGVFFRG